MYEDGANKLPTQTTAKVRLLKYVDIDNEKLMTATPKRVSKKRNANSALRLLPNSPESPVCNTGPDIDLNGDKLRRFKIPKIKSAEVAEKSHTPMSTIPFG